MQPQALDFSLDYTAVWKLYLNPLVIKCITPAFVTTVQNLHGAINQVEFACEGVGEVRVEWSDGREEDYAEGKVFRRNNGHALISALLWPAQHFHEIEQRVREILSVLVNCETEISEFISKALGELLETAATNAESKRNMPASSEIWLWQELCVQHGSTVLSATPWLLRRSLAVALVSRTQFVQEGLAALLAHACALLRQGHDVAEEIKIFCYNLCQYVLLESCPADQFMAFLVAQLSVVILEQRVTIQVPFRVLVKYLNYFVLARSNQDNTLDDSSLRILVAWFARSNTEPLLATLLPFYAGQALPRYCLQWALTKRSIDVLIATPISSILHLATSLRLDMDTASVLAILLAIAKSEPQLLIVETLDMIGILSALLSVDRMYTSVSYLDSDVIRLMVVLLPHWDNTAQLKAVCCLRRHTETFLNLDFGDGMPFASVFCILVEGVDNLATTIPVSLNLASDRKHTSAANEHVTPSLATDQDWTIAINNSEIKELLRVQVMTSVIFIIPFFVI